MRRSIHAEEPGAATARFYLLRRPNSGLFRIAANGRHGFAGDEVRRVACRELASVPCVSARWPPFLVHDPKRAAGALGCLDCVPGFSSWNAFDRPHRVERAVRTARLHSFPASRELDGAAIRFRSHVDNRGTVAIAGDVGATTTGYAAFSASDTGVFVHAKQIGLTGELRWFDRSGNPAGLVGTSAEYIDFELSPDGRLLPSAKWIRSSSRRISGCSMWPATYSMRFTRDLRPTPARCGRQTADELSSGATAMETRSSIGND